MKSRYQINHLKSIRSYVITDAADHYRCVACCDSQSEAQEWIRKARD